MFRSEVKARQDAAPLVSCYLQLQTVEPCGDPPTLEWASKKTAVVELYYGVLHCEAHVAKAPVSRRDTEVRITFYMHYLE